MKTNEQFIEEAKREMEYQIKERFTPNMGGAMRDVLKEFEDLLTRHEEYVTERVREEDELIHQRKLRKKV